MTPDEILQEWWLKGYFDNNRLAFHMAGALVELLDLARELVENADSTAELGIAAGIQDIITDRLEMAHGR